VAGADAVAPAFAGLRIAVVDLDRLRRKARHHRPQLRAQILAETAAAFGELLAARELQRERGVEIARVLAAEDQLVRQSPTAHREAETAKAHRG